MEPPPLLLEATSSALATAAMGAAILGTVYCTVQYDQDATGPL